MGGFSGSQEGLEGGGTKKSWLQGSWAHAPGLAREKKVLFCGGSGHAMGLEGAGAKRARDGALPRRERANDGAASLAHVLGRMAPLRSQKNVLFCGGSGHAMGLSGGDPPNPPCGRRGCTCSRPHVPPHPPRGRRGRTCARSHMRSVAHALGRTCARSHMRSVAHALGRTGSASACSSSFPLP
jgi:hypothetical protein